MKHVYQSDSGSFEISESLKGEEPCELRDALREKPDAKIEVSGITEVDTFGAQFLYFLQKDSSLNGEPRLGGQFQEDVSNLLNKIGLNIPELCPHK